jgi:aerobic carbon-monoxide dehydrogenase large subunit
MSWVGRPLRRFEDPALLLGRGRYTADLARGAAAVRFVRSPVASGRLVRISAPPGALVFTGEDLREVQPIRPVLHRPDYVAVAQPALARGRVNFTGEAVAVVVAADEAAAEDLADAVEVQIEAETPVVDLDEALAPDAPRVHREAEGNVAVDGRLSTPGVAAAFAAAAQIVALELRSARQSALPMEPRAAHASIDPVNGRITLVATTQMPHMLRTGIADCLGMPESMLRVVAPDVGGGFGQKMQLFPEFVVLVWLARQLGRPLSWVEDRRENLLASAHSRDQRYRVRAAFDREARLTALEADIRCNVGAYSCYPTSCGVEPLMALAELPGPYDFREYAVRARGVLTHTCMMAPYRGVSRPMLTFTMERLMDTAARRFGIDPLEIRRRNLVGQFPYRSASGLTYDEGSYRAALDKAAAAIDVPAFRERQRAARAEGRYLGLGFSVFAERSGYGTPAFAARNMEVVPGYETVDMAMDPSGSVEVRIGASPHGQGLRTSLAQLIADALGIDPGAVRVIHGDTDATPYGWGTFASRSLVIAGGACTLAARALAHKIRQIAAQMLEASADDIDLAAGAARIRGTDRSLALGAIAREAYHRSHRLGASLGPGLRESATYDPAGTFSNACHAAIVAVDAATGAVRIERFVVAEDAGILVNPLIVDGQIHGGVAQGVANALFEALQYDSAGTLLTTTLADYLMPTAVEIPPIEIHHLVTAMDEAVSVTRAKGIGEGGAIGAPAAVINALSDALSPLGVDFFEMPVSPQRILEQLRAAGKTGVS